MAIVGSLLLLACAKIGALLVARGAARQQEFAVRVPLGADVPHGGQGLTSRCSWPRSAAPSAWSAHRRRHQSDAVDDLGRAVAGPSTASRDSARCASVPFTIGDTLLAALVFGLMPAIVAFMSAPASARRQGAEPTRARQVFGNGLVVAQAAISMALLSVSKLYMGDLRHLRDESRVRCDRAC